MNFTIKREQRPRFPSLSRNAGFAEQEQKMVQAECNAELVRALPRRRPSKPKPSQALEEGLIVNNYFISSRNSRCSSDNYSLLIIHYSLKKLPFRHSSSDRFFTPATGYRHGNTGALTVVGVSGYYFSSSPWAAGDHGAGRLAFRANNAGPLASEGRSFAFPVRCVQHLQAALIKVKNELCE